MRAQSYGCWTVIAGLLGVSGCTGEEPPGCTEFDEVFVYADADGDGYGSQQAIGYVCTVAEGQSTNNVDCDDQAPEVHPNAPELCDGIDNNCNEVADEAVLKIPWFRDRDGDGFGDRDTREIACAPPDSDFIQLAGDCNDDNPDVNPAAREICNGIDDDCDRFVDDDDPGVDPATYTRWHSDSDNDGYGDPDVYVEACAQVQFHVLDDRDCDDGRADVNPEGAERCNQLDDDCDGLVDDYDPDVDTATQRPMYADTDGDGYGDAGNPIMACGPEPGIASDNALDCDDDDRLASIDQNWHVDGDGDGYGSGPPVTFTCLNPGGGLVPETPILDCVDNDPLHHPGVPEVCFDQFDQNCDGKIDCEDVGCATDPLCVMSCADINLGSQYPVVYAGNTNGQGNQANPTTCAFSNSDDLIFQWVPPATGQYEIDLQGSGYDTVIYVLDGCGGSELACNDDYFGLQSRVYPLLTGGVPILIVVDGYSSNSGPFTLNID